MALVKLLAAVVLCVPALLMPYGLRVRYGLLLARLIHAPYIVFGRLARYILRELGIQSFPAAPDA